MGMAKNVVVAFVMCWMVSFVTWMKKMKKAVKE
jgi:hypothetical protein